MGWFSSDETIQYNTDTTQVLQTIALVVLACVVLAYGLMKVLNNHQRSQSERVARAAVRFQTSTV